ncbi:COQ9 family protein [Sandaracinobacter sp. RS1-74]|uniref:COQ9 family protein n=1 Tax=Sandaracinobacteroides sayramensis TaxID=2913411 RepID=UPI001EDABCEA|nr:COQ9 family protein [Sandaracinobacteroides sayramensis]MCG2842654.1 COQ9 family protein [Sandaracinobacteroides sayramensis]
MVDSKLQELTLDELRPLLVEAMLPHVPFDGWSRSAAEAAATELGLSSAIAGIAFPGGPAEMVEAYIRWADSRMAAALDNPDYRARKVREKVTQAIRTRLEQAAPHREAVRRATTLLALPGNAPRAARLGWRTADAIWRAAGDISTDFNHYSKRALAAAVYASTLLFWLNDDSEDFAETWAFLDRRIGNVMQIEKAKARFRLPGDGERLSPARFLGRLRYPVN